MADYITLLGAEDVQRAANSMRQAADDMQRAANLYQESTYQQQQFMNDWLIRFEQALKESGK